MHSNNFLRKVLLASAFLFFSTPVTAQVIPGSSEAGRVDQRLQEPLKAKSVFKVEVPEKIEEMPDEEADKVRFTLTNVFIEGATVFKEADFIHLFEDKLDTEISLSDLKAVAEKITAFYRNAGYILSKVIIPPQRATDGSIGFKVIEGYIDDVVFEGEIHRKGLFKKWASKIKGSAPLNINVLERYSLLANDLPGVTATAQIKPSESTQGAATLVFAVEHKPIDASATYDNRGSKTSGPREGVINVTANSLLKVYDKTNLMYLNTTDQRELRYFSVMHEEILNSEGLKLTLTGSRVKSNPGHNLIELDMRSRNLSLGSTLSYPVIRSRNENLSVNIGFTYKNSRTDSFNAKISEDRLRVGKIGATYDFADSFQGVNIFDVALHQGINFLNETESGTPLLTRARGRSDFTKVTAMASRNQQLPKNFSLNASVSGQYSATQLLSSEEFGYGGSQYGRGY
ncbi:MAG: ShlB/FhaC/HecB family hemolysin secretion/activation protein, partial [Alphaproteobacteria bacterium]|nr:ShlB/FhaC/HecB family hemolysin secretion/activation protein [Alphaproteobacteria bacterium]